MKVGDYVNYTPDTPTEAQLTALNSAVNTYSGYYDENNVKGTTQSLSQTSGMKWRILELDETGTKPKTLISASTTNEGLTLYGANGYNNAVYLINEACKILYSKEGVGEARSITIEDSEKYYSTEGKNERDNYKENNSEAEGDKYGDTKRYEGTYANYPKIALEEKNIGIDTEPLDEKGKNPLKEEGLNRSEQGMNADGSYKTYEGNEQAKTEKTNGITVKKTYYNLDSLSSNLSSAYKDSAYYNLFCSSISNAYWLASRCVNTDSRNGKCYFEVHYLSSSRISANSLFDSSNNTLQRIHRLRPLVSLKSDIEAEYEGKAEDNAFNIWNI